MVLIDLHCHILPGMDDGPKTMDDALAIVRAGVAAGTTAMVATPHVSWDWPQNTAPLIAEKVGDLRAALAAESIPLEVHAAPRSRSRGRSICPTKSCAQRPRAGGDILRPHAPARRPPLGAGRRGPTPRRAISRAAAPRIGGGRSPPGRFSASWGSPAVRSTMRSWRSQPSSTAQISPPAMSGSGDV